MKIKIKETITKIRGKLKRVVDAMKDWTDRKIFEFVMAHINLEETILIGAAKASVEKYHLTSLFLLLAYYIMRAEVKFKSWFSKKPKKAKVEDE